MLNNGQFAPLSIRPSPGRHASQRSYLTGVLSSYSPLHGPVSGITMLFTNSTCSGCSQDEIGLYPSMGLSVLSRTGWCQAA